MGARKKRGGKAKNAFFNERGRGGSKEGSRRKKSQTGRVMEFGFSKKGNGASRRKQSAAVAREAQRVTNRAKRFIAESSSRR